MPPVAVATKSCGDLELSVAEIAAPTAGCCAPKGAAAVVTGPFRLGIGMKEESFGELSYTRGGGELNRPASGCPLLAVCSRVPVAGALDPDVI